MYRDTHGLHRLSLTSRSVKLKDKVVTLTASWKYLTGLWEEKGGFLVSE